MGRGRGTGRPGPHRGRRRSRWRGSSDLFRLRLTPDPHEVDAAAASGLYGSPQASAERWLAGRLTNAGAGNVLVTIEDPSSPGSWTALVEKKPRPDPLLRVESAEPVMTKRPPALVRANTPSLDARILSDEARAVALALLKDTDPERLEGMAACFAPDLPVVGALLHTRARLEKTRRERRPEEIVEQGVHEQDVTRRLSTPLSHGGKGLGRKTGAPFVQASDQAGIAVDMLRQATLGLGAAAASTWDRYGGAVRVLLPEDEAIGGEAIEDTAVESVTRGAPASSVDVATAFDGVCRCVGLASCSPEDLARELDVDLDVARAVISCVKRPGGGVVLIDPLRAAALSGLAPPPSASAIQLASGQVRPLDVGLSDPTHAGRTLLAMRRAGPYDEAAAQVERAKRAVARRVWVEWWARAERAGMLGDIR